MILAELVTTLDHTIFGTVLVATAALCNTPCYRHLIEFRGGFCCFSSAVVVLLLATTPTGEMLGQPLGRHVNANAAAAALDPQPHKYTDTGCI